MKVNELLTEPHLAPAELAAVDRLCLRFENGWKAGERPSLEDRLEGASTATRSHLFRELLLVELHYRSLRGEVVSPQEYRARFPAYAEIVTEAFLSITPCPNCGTGTNRTLGRCAYCGTKLPPPSTMRVGPMTELARAPSLAEGFEILGMLGRGGMGTVYKARQLKLDRLVALKVIRTSNGVTEDELKRFRREAAVIAQLDHPNIVKIYEVGEVERCPFLVLELAEGGSLERKLGGEPLPFRKAAELALAVASGVQHAHERGVLHRDLKPANVLMSGDGLPKITDFGLAKRLDSNLDVTRTGAILGTPGYMAPEQAEGRVGDLGPATDVWALGAVLYECLTGRRPFQGATISETLDLLRSQDVIPPTALRQDLPRDLETICMKCLEKDPGLRYGSAAALAADLMSFLQGDPISARQPTLLERLTRLVRRQTIPAQVHSWGAVLLAVSPIPVLVQVGLYLLFAHLPSYPLICLAVILVAASGVSLNLLRRSRPLLRQVPRADRLHLWSLAVSRYSGWLAILVIVSLMRPGLDLKEFFLVIPMWLVLDASLHVSLGRMAGMNYLVAFLHVAAAVFVAVFPITGPVIMGVVNSVTILAEGVYLRDLGRAAGGARRDDADGQASSCEAGPKA